jgi:hypothetical protein
MESRHGKRLKGRLIVRRAEILEAMARGVEPDKYRQMVGHAQGLDEAINLSDEVDREQSGE